MYSHVPGICPGSALAPSKKLQSMGTVLWAGCCAGLFESAARRWVEFGGNESRRRWPGQQPGLKPSASEPEQWSSMFHVSSVFRGGIDSHCPRSPRTSWSHGTPRTSRCPRSVHFLSLFPNQQQAQVAFDCTSICSNPETQSRSQGRREKRS